MGGGFAVMLSLFALTIAALSTHIAANVVSPTNALINAAPRLITFRVGGLVTAGLGVVRMPWKLLESTGGHVFTWFIGYGALLGPIGGILIVDYFLPRRATFDLDGQYHHDRPHKYVGGFNPVAILGLVVAVLPNVPGFAHAAGYVDSVPAVFDQLSTCAWFLGCLVAGVVCLVEMRLMPGVSSAALEAAVE